MDGNLVQHINIGLRGSAKWQFCRINRQKCGLILPYIRNFYLLSSHKIKYHVKVNALKLYNRRL